MLELRSLEEEQAGFMGMTEDLIAIECERHIRIEQFRFDIPDNTIDLDLDVVRIGTVSQVLEDRFFAPVRQQLIVVGVCKINTGHKTFSVGFYWVVSPLRQTEI